MPIGTSDGEFFEDRWDYTVRAAFPVGLTRVPITKDDPMVVPPPEDGDYGMVVDPFVMQQNKKLDDVEVDPEVGLGLEISAEGPPQAPTKPTGALKQDEGGKGFFDRLSIVNPISAMLKGPNFEEDIAIAKGLWGSVKSAFTLPGQVARGEVDPSSVEAVRRSIDLAGIAVLGPAPVASKLADGTLGSFIGVKAKTFDKERLAEAQRMANKNATGDEIWEKTQTFKGADGRWRQEVPDNTAIVKGAAEQGKLKPLSEVYDHPELYKAYPDLKDLPVAAFEDLGPNQFGRAAYDPSNDVAYVGKNATVDDFVHEIQHAIQVREGFAKGGTVAAEFALRFEEEVRKAAIQSLDLVKKFKERGLSEAEMAILKKNERLLQVDLLRKQLAAAEAESHYMRLAGEVEARNVETRGGLTNKQLREYAPYWTQDTPSQRQIVSDKSIYATPYGVTDNPMIAPDYP